MNIKEFAELMGVSTATISRASTGGKGVGIELRQKILAKMDEVGYYPNHHAKKLASNQTHMIAMPYIGFPHFNEPFLRYLTSACLSATRKEGYEFNLNLSYEDWTKKDIDRWLMSGVIDGFIMNYFSSPEDKRFYELANLDIPKVIISKKPFQNINKGATIVIGMQAGAQEMARHFYMNGHRNVGIIDLEKGLVVDDQVQNAFRAECNMLGMNIADRDVYYGTLNVESGSEGLKQLMRINPKITAVFCRTDILALGALNEARRLGLNVPGDLSIAGHDDFEFATISDPKLTTVNFNISQLASMAVKTLMELIVEPKLKVNPMIICTELVARDSTGICPAKLNRFISFDQ